MEKTNQKTNRECNVTLTWTVNVSRVGYDGQVTSSRSNGNVTMSVQQVREFIRTVASSAIRGVADGLDK